MPTVTLSKFSERAVILCQNKYVYRKRKRPRQTYRLKLISANHPFNEVWTLENYEALLNYFKILLACHPDLIHRISSNHTLTSEKGKLFQQQFIEDSQNYVHHVFMSGLRRH